MSRHRPVGTVSRARQNWRIQLDLWLGDSPLSAFLSMRTEAFGNRPSCAAPVEYRIMVVETVKPRRLAVKGGSYWRLAQAPLVLAGAGVVGWRATRPAASVAR